MTFRLRDSIFRLKQQSVATSEVKMVEIDYYREYRSNIIIDDESTVPMGLEMVSFLVFGEP